jgi:transaldolase
VTRFILDSGNPDEYQPALDLFTQNDQTLWGSTTNPSLIAKKLSEEGRKLTLEEAFSLQKDIVRKILRLVPGAVSAEVYADSQTSAEEMIEQGREISKWDERIVIKLPTTKAGFKARTQLRKENIVTNNTLVFSQQQIYAICLHEHLLRKEFQVNGKWPCFISPFLGRLDDIGEDGTALVRNGMELKKHFSEGLWMLAASIRSTSHLKACIELGSELITAPLKVYGEWLEGVTQPRQIQKLAVPGLWEVPAQVKEIENLDDFFEAVDNKTLDITHILTDKGIDKFTEDWRAILK